MPKPNDQTKKMTPARNRPASKLQTDDLIQVRLTYVWDLWKFHAKQRTDMFNYFLIITGILANAYVTLLKNGDRQHALAVGLGLLGIITSVGFCLLDIRNRKQLERATDILIKIEAGQLGIQGKPLGLADISGSLIYKHKFVFRVIEGIVGFGWFLIIFWNLLSG